RHAVLARRRGPTVPMELRVVVRVRVDEAGRDEQSVRIQRFGGVVRCRADRDDPSVLDGDVRDQRVGAGPVDDRATLDQVVEHAHANPYSDTQLSRTILRTSFSGTRSKMSPMIFWLCGHVVSECG